MFPLSTASPVPLYAMQEYKCLVVAMEEMERESDGDCMHHMDRPCTLVSYQGRFETTKFSPLVVIRSLIAEVEALQDHIKVREEWKALRQIERATADQSQQAELAHLRSLYFTA